MIFSPQAPLQSCLIPNTSNQSMLKWSWPIKCVNKAVGSFVLVLSQLFFFHMIFISRSMRKRKDKGKNCLFNLSHKSFQLGHFYQLAQCLNILKYHLARFTQLQLMQSLSQVETIRYSWFIQNGVLQMHMFNIFLSFFSFF